MLGILDAAFPGGEDVRSERFELPFGGDVGARSACASACASACGFAARGIVFAKETAQFVLAFAQFRLQALHAHAHLSIG